MRQPKRLWLAVLIAILLALFLSSYVGAYVATQSKAAQTGTNGREVFTVRYYPADWHVVLFGPLAAIESVFRNHEVQLEYTP